MGIWGCTDRLQAYMVCQPLPCVGAHSHSRLSWVGMVRMHAAGGGVPSVAQFGRPCCVRVPVVWFALRVCPTVYAAMAAVGFEPMPLRTGGWSERIIPIGQPVMWHHVWEQYVRNTVGHSAWFAHGVSNMGMLGCIGRFQAYMVCQPPPCVGAHISIRLI